MSENQGDTFPQKGWVLITAICFYHEDLVIYLKVAEDRIKPPKNYERLSSSTVILPACRISIAWSKSLN